ncbi:hypothetical protein LTR50_004831 [Elasticomyces elasticus]|nr:hypothetical protein LTR50_004831 [Elasticomyces elasticus]
MSDVLNNHVVAGTTADESIAPAVPAHGHAGVDGTFGGTGTTALETNAAAAPETTATTVPKTTTAATQAPLIESAAAEPTQAMATATEGKALEPIQHGTLGYKAPGIMKFKFSKRYFWFGDDPISAQHLSHYLRGEKPEIAQPTAAWATKTGRGLLFLSKFAHEKDTPAHAFNLSDISGLEREKKHEFSFKLHGQKHTFQAADDAERDGWYMAMEREHELAKEAREHVLSSPEYKESVSNLGKTNALAGGVAAGTAAAMTKSHGHSTSTPKKSTDLTETTRRNRSSSSSSSNDERAAASKSKSKSRSVSRGKGAGFLGAFMGKKEEHDAKKEVKKEENGEATEEIREAKHDTTAERALEMGEHKHHHGMAVPLVGGAAAGTALDAEAIGYLQHPVAMLTTHEASRVMEAPATEILPTSTESGVVSDATTGPVGTTKGTVTPPKPTKRNSIFGAIFEKVRSPTSEKKEPDFAPAVPPKDVERSTGPPVLPETTTTIEIPAIATASDTRHAVPESSPHVNATTPRKEKESFLGGWMNKARAKSPSATHERKGSAHERRGVASEAPTVPAKFDDPIATAPNGVDKLDIPAEPSTAAATATTPDAVKERRQSSFFGLAAGNNADGKASVSSKFGSIFRRNSQAVRAAKEGQTSSTTTAAAHETAAPAEHVGTDGLLGGAAAAPVAAVRQPGEAAAGDAVDAITPVHAHAGNAGSNAVSASA